MLWKKVKKSERISWLVLLLCFLTVLSFSCAVEEDPQPRSEESDQKDNQLLELIGAIDN
ncbi:hypothetical protein SAMN04488029_1335 [Reichenbachiella faecimaris]|uniref:Uncharacterized protein n=1 Tax=Reichenbachiella faecimaris TaxID=692418 RepID=A0A1W2G8Z7_REIFA|nr:hypothetical protein SAMN04488029_1335 [Reichenbachiella faecimaris]